MADNYLEHRAQDLAERKAKRERQHQARLRRYRLEYIKRLKADNNNQNPDIK